MAKPTTSASKNEERYLLLVHLNDHSDMLSMSSTTTMTVPLTFKNFSCPLQRPAKEIWMIDLKSLLICEHLTFFSTSDLTKGFCIDRYDISDDGHIDQKELASMISAMVRDEAILSSRCSRMNLFLLSSTISSVKPTAKGIKIRRSVLLKLSQNLILVVIRNWTKPSLSPGKSDTIVSSDPHFICRFRCKGDPVIRQLLAPNA